MRFVELPIAVIESWVCGHDDQGALSAKSFEVVKLRNYTGRNKETKVLTLHYRTRKCGRNSCELVLEID